MHGLKRRVDIKEEKISVPVHIAIQIIQIKHRRKRELQKTKELQ